MFSRMSFAFIQPEFVAMTRHPAAIDRLEHTFEEEASSSPRPLTAHAAAAALSHAEVVHAREAIPLRDLGKKPDHQPVVRKKLNLAVHKKRKTRTIQFASDFELMRIARSKIQKASLDTEGNLRVLVCHYNFLNSLTQNALNISGTPSKKRETFSRSNLSNSDSIDLI